MFMVITFPYVRSFNTLAKSCPLFDTNDESFVYIPKVMYTHSAAFKYIQSRQVVITFWEHFNGIKQSLSLIKGTNKLTVDKLLISITRTGEDYKHGPAEHSPRRTNKKKSLLQITFVG